MYEMRYPTPQETLEEFKNLQKELDKDPIRMLKLFIDLEVEFGHDVTDLQEKLVILKREKKLKRILNG